MLDRLTTALTTLASIALAFMASITICDVLMKNLVHRPIRGTFDLVDLTLVVVVFLGLPDVFRRGTNIVVDVADHFLNPFSRQVLVIVARVLTLLFMLLIFYAMVRPASDAIVYPEHQQETGIATWVLWSVILFGTASSVLVMIGSGWRSVERDQDGSSL